jgi:hypothetical protein
LCGGKYKVPWDEYHGIPKGWEGESLLEKYRALGGKLNIVAGCEKHKPHSWPESRCIVENIANGIKANDAACIELSIQYIEQRFIISCSGYIRARMARRLKNASLHEKQRQRLVEHIFELLTTGDRCLEFKQYLRLMRRLITSKERSAFTEAARALGGYSAEVAKYLSAPDRQPWSSCP